MSDASHKNPVNRLTFAGQAPRICVIVDWFREEYQLSILQGIASACEARGWQMLAISVGIIGSSQRDHLVRNAIWNRVTKEEFDGAIILTGTVANAIGPTRFAETLRDFNRTPIVSVGIPIEDHLSIAVDNQSGVTSTVRHLVLDHGYKKFAVLSGPSHNAEAKVRQESTLKALSELGIEPSAIQVFEGDFRSGSGKKFAQQLCSHRTRDGRLSIDALICANDAMALGASEEFTREKIRIPAQLAVMGFDDIPESRFCTPTLATVRQPLHEQGTESVKLLASALQSSLANQHQALEAKIVPRQSCGCTVARELESRARPSGTSGLSFGSSIVSKRERLHIQILRAARGQFAGLPLTWEEKLLFNFSDSVEFEETKFIALLEEYVRKVLEKNGELEPWHHVLDVLREECLPFVEAGSDQHQHMEDLCHTARTLISEAVARSFAQRSAADKKLTQALLDILSTIGRAESWEDAFDALGEGMAQLNLSRLLLIFDESTDSEQLLLAELINGGAAYSLRLDQCKKSDRLLNSEEWEGWQGRGLAIIPLYAGSHVYGRVAFDVTASLSGIAEPVAISLGGLCYRLGLPKPD